MKIQINTTAKAIELSNYVLGQSINQLTENPDIAERMDLSKKDIEAIEGFRKKMLEGFLKAAQEA